MKKINNKGFTLIEIIGIIVILAVIMIVTVPMLENTLRQQKSNNYRNFLKNLSLVMENYIADHQLSGVQECTTLETLLEERYIDEIPVHASANPLIAGEELFSSDNVCGTKNDNNVYEFDICRGGYCKNVDGFLSTEKAYLDMDKFRTIASKYRENSKSVYFVDYIDTSNAIEGSVVDLSDPRGESITGWAVANSDSGFYDYYVGSKDMIYAKTLYDAFYDWDSMESISFENLATNEVTDMSYMFYAPLLTELDLSNFDTSNVIDMSYMFDVEALTELDLSNFDTSRVTDMSYMFYAPLLTELDLGSFDTSSVTNMSYMFYGIYSLTELDLTGFNTSRVTNMEGMFTGIDSLTELDLGSFDTSSVTNMSVMFYAPLLTELDLGSFDTSSVTNMSWMFYAPLLTELDLSNFDTSRVTNMEGMFCESLALTTLDLSSFNTSRVTNMSWMFSGATSLTNLDISNFTFNDDTKNDVLAESDVKPTVTVNSASEDIVKANMPGATVVVKRS